MKLVVPRAGLKELYLVSRYGQERVAGKGRRVASFLRALGLEKFEGFEGEFEQALSGVILDKLGFREVLEEAARHSCVNPVAVAALAGARGVEISKTSAKNLLKLLRELGCVVRLKSWLVFTPSLKGAVLAVLASKGEAKVGELEKFFGLHVREEILKLWAEGRVEVEGNPRSPLRGRLDLPRELVLKHSFEYSEDLIKAMKLEKHPRLEKDVDRSTGKVVYAIILREDDRVRLVAGCGQGND